MQSFYLSKYYQHSFYSHAIIEGLFEKPLNKFEDSPHLSILFFEATIIQTSKGADLLIKTQIYSYYK